MKFIREDWWNVLSTQDKEALANWINLPNVGALPFYADRIKGEATSIMDMGGCSMFGDLCPTCKALNKIGAAIQLQKRRTG